MTEEPLYSLSQNDFTKILNSDLQQSGMKEYIACVATHNENGLMHYVLFCSMEPIRTSTNAEDIAAHIDIIKLHKQFEALEEKRNGRKKVSRRGNRNMSH